MQVLQNLKVVKVTPPAVIVDAASLTTDTIDTKGWDEALFIVELGATDIAMTALKVQESDDSGMSGAEDITGADFSVSPATLPSATADNTQFGVHVKLGGSRKRYLDVVATGGDGSAGAYISVYVILSKGKEAPDSTSERGFNQLLYV